MLCTVLNPQVINALYSHCAPAAGAADTEVELKDPIAILCLFKTQCRYAVSMLDPIRIGSKALARGGQNESCMPACLWIRSTWPQPDTVSQNQIGSRLVLYNIIQDICGRTEPSLKVGNWWRAVCVLPVTGPDDSCTPASFRTGSVWPRPDTISQD